MNTEDLFGMAIILTLLLLMGAAYVCETTGQFCSGDVGRGDAIKGETYA